MRLCSKWLLLLPIFLFCSGQGPAVAQAAGTPGQPSVSQPEKQLPLNIDRDPVRSPDGEGEGQTATTIGRDNGRYTL
jgi:hypothetical protein